MASPAVLSDRGNGAEDIRPSNLDTEDRAQWVEITHKLESAPLDDSVNKQGDAALKRLSDVHDIHVPLCPALLTSSAG